MILAYHADICMDIYICVCLCVFVCIFLMYFIMCADICIYTGLDAVRFVFNPL